MGMSYKDIKLNSAQREAIEYIDGPLLVVAGPGTGKTQLLSSRVAHILQNTDTLAKNILCLTFTNKAALNMKQRLLDITDGKARDVDVKTFHSFASEIMNIYPDYFWNGARLSTAPDAVQQEIIQNILSDLPLKNPLALKFYGKFTSVSDVLQGLKLAKEAGLTPEKLEAIINANLAYIGVVEKDLVSILSDRLNYKKLAEFQAQIHALPDQNIDDYLTPLVSLSTTIKESLAQAINQDTDTGKTKNTGEWKKRWIQTVNGDKGMFTERRRNDWWLHLADVYAKYRKDLHSRGYYDYSDMLVEVLTQIENNPELLASVQEQFNYVMIDEFQDTNAAQLRLAHLVSDHHTTESKPNIMAVGDDDQSIFKFNGAELSNMLHFRRSYPSAKTVVLKENYRSTQDILDLSEKIVNQASDRLVLRDATLDKHLISKVDSQKSAIKHLTYHTQDEQLHDIAKKIAKNYSADSTTAIIARGHASLIRIASLLIAQNVPLNYEQQRNILDHPIIQQISLLSTICSAINNGEIELLNSALASTLRHPMWGIEAKELWRLAVKNYSGADWLQSLLDHKDQKIATHGVFLLELAKLTVDENLSVAFEYVIGLREVNEVLDLRKTSQLPESIRGDSEGSFSDRGEPVSSSKEETELLCASGDSGVTGILRKSSRSPVYTYYVQNRKSDPNEYLHGLSAIRTLRGLVAEYSSNKSATLEDFTNFITLEQNSGAVINDESPFVTGEHAVSLLTVHKAKGLEFDDVYIVDAVENNWQPRVGGRKPPANLPLQPSGDDMDDYVRLMFVAVTRARSNLTISSFNSDISGRETLPTPLISSVLEGEHTKSDVSPIEILETSISWPRLDTLDKKLLLKARMQNYSLSVTHLLNFLDVTSGGPAKFLERNLLRLPEVKTSSLAYGSAMHSALETAQKLVNTDAFGLKKVILAYEKALESEHLPSSEEHRYKKHGRENLEHLFNDKFLVLEKGSAPEQNITDIFIGDTRVSGKLDRIDQADNRLIVSDYKTGTPLNSFETKAENLAVKAWKQRTQLIFYAMLLQNSTRFETKNKDIVGQMIYLEADNQKDFIRKYAPSAEEIERLAKLTQGVWTKIINLDLPDITKYPQTYTGIVQFEEDLLNS